MHSTVAQEALYILEKIFYSRPMAVEGLQAAINWTEHPLRSLLFTPGSDAHKLEKVGTFSSDVIVLDLEDAVADSEKEAARALIRAALPTYGAQLVAVRINGADTPHLEGDVRAVVTRDLDCLVVPKVEAPESLAEVDALLGELEREHDLAPRQVRLIATIETAKGLVRAEEIALAVPGRLLTLVFGLVDFARDLGLDPTRGGNELLYARSRVVVAARAAGLRAPIDGPYVDLHDLDGLAQDSRRSRQHGFEGRVVIHPAQVEPVQRAYGELPPEEVETLRRQVEAFERAEAEGRASLQVDGRFIDYPVYYQAKQKLHLHESLRTRVAG